MGCLAPVASKGLNGSYEKGAPRRDRPQRADSDGEQAKGGHHTFATRRENARLGTGATLAIADLDRLSRNAAFLLAQRDSWVRFLAVDMSEANDFTVGVMALVAQAEREAISRPTKEALTVAKARGVKLGNPNGFRVCAGPGKVGRRSGRLSRQMPQRLQQTWRRCSPISRRKGTRR
jgi:DNA invertase Pin-like site-specific DNA recombinase